MTTRETKTVKGILDVLHEEEGHQLGEIQLHAKLNEHLHETISLAELAAALAMVDMRGWVIVVPQKFKRGVLRSISEAGEAARLEM